MGVWCNDAMLDTALNWLKNGADKLCLCSQQPTSYTEATSTYCLGSIAIGSANFGEIEDGLVSGRRVTVNVADAIPVGTTGVLNHVALVSDISQELLYVVPCPERDVAQGSEVVLGQFYVELRDPISV